jgi:hypothetical protein
VIERERERERGVGRESKFSLTSKINEVDFKFSLTNNESKKH